MYPRLTPSARALVLLTIVGTTAMSPAWRLTVVTDNAILTWAGRLTIATDNAPD